MSKTRTISAYLLRPDVVPPDGALAADAGELARHDVRAAGPDAALFVSVTPDKEPEWASLFTGAAAPPLNLRRPSFAAVLFVQARGRWFALTFGNGRFLLSPACYERGFGLRVALNIVEPALIRSVQSRTFSDHALQVRRQSSGLTDIVELELDVQRDLLTTLEGAVAPNEIGKRLVGADSVRLTHAVEAKDLQRTCGELLLASRRKDFKKRFPWIANIEQISQERVIDSLDHKVLTLLMSGEFDKFDVYPPEMVDDAIVEFSSDHATRFMVTAAMGFSP